ncbi:hypothetical protein ABK040_015811 [Willaertia magna]
MSKLTNNNELSSYQVSTIDGKIKNIPFSINDRKIFSNLTEEECNTIFDDKKGNLFMLFTTTTYNSEETTHLLVILETRIIILKIDHLYFVMDNNLIVLTNQNQMLGVKVDKLDAIKLMWSLPLENFNTINKSNLNNKRRKVNYNKVGRQRNYKLNENILIHYNNNIIYKVNVLTGQLITKFIVSSRRDAEWINEIVNLNNDWLIVVTQYSDFFIQLININTLQKSVKLSLTTHKEINFCSNTQYQLTQNNEPKITLLCSHNSWGDGDYYYRYQLLGNLKNNNNSSGLVYTFTNEERNSFQLYLLQSYKGNNIVIYEDKLQVYNWNNKILETFSSTVINQEGCAFSNKEINYFGICIAPNYKISGESFIINN